MLGSKASFTFQVSEEKPFKLFINSTELQWKKSVGKNVYIYLNSSKYFVITNKIVKNYDDQTLVRINCILCKNEENFYLNIPKNVVDFYRLTEKGSFELMVQKKPFEKILVHIKYPEYEVISDQDYD